MLDTHVLIWVLENNPIIKGSPYNLITDNNNSIFISSASVWEINIKKATGKLIVPDDLQQQIKKHQFIALPINPRTCRIGRLLPSLHKDPFDRMLVAQAKLEKMTILTKDSQVQRYDVNTISV